MHVWWKKGKGKNKLKGKGQKSKRGTTETPISDLSAFAVGIENAVSGRHTGLPLQECFPAKLTVY